MKNIKAIYSILALVFNSCSAFPGPRNIDWQKEWHENRTKLKILAQDISLANSKKYRTGNNNFPIGFKYPFDEGFFISKPSSYTTTDSTDRAVTVRFYLDRGISDHYSAIIFTNDSSEVKSFDENVSNGGNDFKLEPNWYIIND
jgi:hypothetical protein